MRVAAWLLCGLTLWLCVPASALDGPTSVDQWLGRLSRALQEKNYRGLFTYEFGGTLDTLEIVHGVDNGVEHERLRHLSGPSREFVRNGRSAKCVTTASHLLRGMSLNGAAVTDLTQYYDFQVVGEDRIAGRKAKVIHIKPRDQYRYGHTLYIDKASGIPLKLLITAGPRVLERTQFLELQVGLPFDAMEFDPKASEYLNVSSASGFCADTAMDVPPEGDPLLRDSAAQNVPHWRAQWLPGGFTLTAQSYSSEFGHQLTYTDGLASFSVFVLPLQQGDIPQSGVAQRGATVALMAFTEVAKTPVNVTVIGEIPPVTAEGVSRAIRSFAAGNSQ